MHAHIIRYIKLLTLIVPVTSFNVKPADNDILFHHLVAESQTDNKKAVWY